MARAHAVRLIHNDIKPANLFLNAEGEALVGDFGFAAAVPPGATTTPIPGATAETTAPEVAGSWPAPVGSVLSDVYSLGATAYWLLAATPAHDLRGAVGPDARMAAAATATTPPIRDLAPHVPQYVATTIGRAMSRSPADRFQSAIDFATALGNRPGTDREWVRTDEDAAHLACFRGVPTQSGTTYLVCVEQGHRPTQMNITTRHADSRRRILAECGTVTRSNLPQALRGIMGRLT